MRVHELAKKLGKPSRELILDLQQMGLTVASHSSALREETVQKVLGAPGPIVSPSSRVARKAGGARLAPPPPEAPPKSGRRLVLIKRKEPEAVPRGQTVGQSFPEGARPAPVLESLAATPELSAPSDIQRETSRSAAEVTAVPPAPEEVPDFRKKLRTLQRQTDRETQDDLRHGGAWKDLRGLSTRPRGTRSRPTRPSATAAAAVITKPRKKVIKLSQHLTVKEFGELIGQRTAEVTHKLREMGLTRALHQPIPLDAASLITEGLGLKAEVLVAKEADELLAEAVQSAGGEELVSRPPIVTVMGHVDHGKTSLLDAIRQTRVTEQEVGGITQRIGAYTVPVRGKHVTFIDTPGHEAFAAMRARGAKVTDLVVLVVAADDGVMPQTVEAIHHATAAGVPSLVAINKIDTPEANPERVKHALAEHNLIPEAWGGGTIVVEVSARRKQGLEALLEMILLQTEVMELKAAPHRPANGVVLEAKLDRGRGPVATMLVQNGTLRVGDVLVVGAQGGRVRAINSDTGARVKEAGPSVPVEIIGLPGVPAAGDPFVVVKDERVAREIAEQRLHEQRAAEQTRKLPRVTLEDLSAQMKEGAIKELPVIIKADLGGSVEALSDAVGKLSTQAVRLRVIHSGVGSITETDVLLAAAARAIIIGFSVRPEPKVTALAEHEGVEIRLYSVIYEAIEHIKAAMEGLLEPVLKEHVQGRAEVRQIFTIPKVGVIGGSYVTDGLISRVGTSVRVIRDHVTVYEGKVASLRRFKEDVREVQKGYECGLGIAQFNDLKPGDILEAFVVEEMAATL